MSQYRVYGVSMINLEHRLNYAVQGYWQDEFYYGYGSTYYDPIYSPYIDRDLATSTRSNRGASAFGIYPLDRYRRLEFSGGFGYIKEQYNDPTLDQIANDYQQQVYGNTLYRNGWYVPLSVSFVQETTIFREFGPLSGSTMRLMYETAPGFGGDMLSWQTVDADVRKYYKVGSSALLALRGRAFRSWGATPSFTYFGGNSDLRGYDYLQFAGQNAVYGNAEFRIPLVDAMATPIGILGGIRGVVYFGIGGAWWDNSGYVFGTNKSEVITPIVGVDIDPVTGLPIYQYGDPVAINGFRLVDGRASYGIGLQTMALGFPVHFDWSWRTMFNETWEDAYFGSPLNAEAWRKARFQFWIGFDF
jgi:outer membrane protein assembly factor BamA